jgi:hypothetical protein
MAAVVPYLCIPLPFYINVETRFIGVELQVAAEQWNLKQPHEITRPK